MDLEGLISLNLWMIVPLVILGSALHFAYEWSGRHRLAAIFGAVNESYWEHIKVAFWPILALQVVSFALGGWRIPSFVPAATVALYSIPVGMIGLVYLYKHVVGRNVLWVDIGVFALVVALAQVIFVNLLEQLEPEPITVVLAVGYLVGLLVSFLRFTRRPPREPDIFIDPITGRYGLEEPPTSER